jgi:hypothetical protein
VKAVCFFICDFKMFCEVLLYFDDHHVVDFHAFGV